jgi:GNAT superfamily N-acetyltransferase
MDVAWDEPGHVRLAGPADVDAAAARIADAFHPLALSAWLVADPGRRSHVLFEVLRVHLEFAVSSGWVWLADNDNGVAVWLPGGIGPPPGHDGRLAAAASVHAPRFRYLGEAFDGRRPRRSHLLLTFLAVAPQRQRHGIGSALLAWQHRALDRGGTPVYLEASSVASRRLYLRHGYRDYGPAVDLPGGPRLWPMIREPGPPVPPARRPLAATGPEPSAATGPEPSAATGPEPSDEAGPGPSDEAGPGPSAAAGRAPVVPWERL